MQAYQVTHAEARRSALMYVALWVRLKSGPCVAEVCPCMGVGDRASPYLADVSLRACK